MRDGGGGRGREIIYLSLHRRHQNDSCIKMGSDESYFNVLFTVKDKVPRQVSTDHNLFEEKGEPSRSGESNRTEALLLTSLNAFTARPNRLTQSSSLFGGGGGGEGGLTTHPLHLAESNRGPSAYSLNTFTARPNRLARFLVFVLFFWSRSAPALSCRLQHPLPPPPPACPPPPPPPHSRFGQATRHCCCPRR